MTRLKYLDPADGQYKLLPVGGGAEEVTVSGTEPVGAARTELWVNQAAQFNDPSYGSVQTGFRNVIRNGDMSIYQRGVGPFTAPDVYTLDGWVLSFSGGSCSVSRSFPDVSRSAMLSAVVVGGAGASEYALINHRIEDVSTLAGKQVTMSFDAMSASGTPKISFEIVQHFGTGGSGPVYVSLGAVTISPTRTRYSFTGTLPAITGKTLGAGPRLSLNIWLSAGSSYASRASNIGIQNNTFSITDVQLEEGKYATPFERLPVQQQLAWCQRYFQRIGASNPNVATRDYQPFGEGVLTSASRAYIYLHFAGPMRTVPAFTFTAANTFSLWNGMSVATLASIAGLAPDGRMATLDVGSSAAVGAGGQSCVLQRSTGALAYLDFSAEL